MKGRKTSPEAFQYRSFTPNKFGIQKSESQTTNRFTYFLTSPKIQDSSSPSADITFNYSTRTGNGTYARPSLTDASDTHQNIVSQQIWFAAGWTSNLDKNVTPQSYGNAVYIHEIGHALGLSHPGVYNGTGSYDSDAEYSKDNRQFSIMSYFGGYDKATNAWTQNGTFQNWLYPDTPMVDDIAAIQSLYGVDTNTRATNTTYGLIAPCH